MKQQKDVFMTLLTGLGAALGIITYFLCTFLFHKYETIGALSIFGLAMIKCLLKSRFMRIYFSFVYII